MLIGMIWAHDIDLNQQYVSPVDLIGGTITYHSHDVNRTSLRGYQSTNDVASLFARHCHPQGN